MRRLIKKILRALICFLSIILLPNVYADVNLSTQTLDFTANVSTPMVTRNLSSHYFANLGKGHLIFSFVTYGTPMLGVKGIYVDSYPSAFTCSFTTLPVFDNGYNDYATFSVDCPVQMGAQGLTAVYFDFPGVSVNQQIKTSYNMTFVPDSATNFSQLLSVTQQLYTDIGFGFARQYEQLNQIIVNTTNSNTLNQQIIDKLQESNKEISDLKDSITSSDTSTSQSTANSFFDSFSTDTYGLSDVVTMPLALINSLTSSTCVSLDLTIPFVNKELELPCMSSIYSQFFGSFFTLYQTVTFGFVAYWVAVRIFNLVKDFKNPDHDEIEVLDL